MMTYYTSITLLAMSVFFINPVKMTMWMAMSSSMLMFSLYQFMGSSWVPIMIYLLFMGGIIMMFMILSSTMPNQKLKSSKKNMTFMISTLMIMAISSQEVKTTETCEMVQQMKTLITNCHTMLAMLIVMLIYFSMFMYMIKNNKMSLRSLM